jgi:hypothetical protein
MAVNLASEVMMKRIGLLAILIVAVAGFCGAAGAPVTFNKDVLPVLEKRCQECHRPGEIAPMSFMTYEAARPWAKAMKAAVLTKKMPPWFAEEGTLPLANDRTLTPSEMQTIVAWADGGAAEGDAKDKPAPRTFVDGWNLKPDMIIEMPTEVQLPATGAVEYQYMKVKGNFPEDLWIAAAEMRPGNRQVVHHGEVWAVPPGSKWMANAEYGKAYAMTEMPKQNADNTDIIGKFNPGVGAQNFVLGDSAKLIPKGSDLIFEIHYTTMGKPTTDRTKVGLVFAKGEHKSRYFTSYGPIATNLKIAAGDSNGEVVGEFTTTADMKLVYAQPHMHVRGKDYELRAIYPSGEMQTLLKAKWDFNWQLGFEFAEPVVLPKGTRLLGISHFDNSPNNPFNPDPKKEVVWGLQNWEEMSNCFIGLVFDSGIDPKRISKRSGPSLLPVGPPGPTMAVVDLKPARP